MDALRHALVRDVPATFADATVAVPAGPIDVDRARRQHRAYVEALRSAGLAVTALPAEDRFPDCCFVEDTALAWDGVALVAALGNPSRRGEEEAVREALRAAGFRIETTDLPATFEGGDCMRVGGRLFVGLSARTNAMGLERIASVFGPLGLEVTGVPVAGGLHLKSVCSPLPDGTVLLAEGTVPAGAFGGLEVLTVPSRERAAANVLALGDAVLVAEGFPETRRRLERAGVRAIPIDNSEIRRADGAFTCCSILW
jgi:dimethylargininase